MAASGAGMSERWAERLAAAVLGQVFEDLTSTRPGRDRDVSDRPRILAHRREHRQAWLDAAEWCFSPEDAEHREHWFRQAGIRQPATVEGMVAAIQSYARGGPETLVDSDEDGADFEEPLVEELTDEEDEEAA